MMYIRGDWYKFGQAYFKFDFMDDFWYYSAVYYPNSKRTVIRNGSWKSPTVYQIPTMPDEMKAELL